MSSDAIVNVGARLSEMARGRPDQLAVVAPLGRDRTGRRQYARMTFRELDEDSDAIAAGLRQYGARPGMRLVLLVKPSVDFISLVFGLFKSGVVTVLIDPGMGRGNLIRCLSECEPDGFVAIPMAQAIRTVLRYRFPKAKLNVTVGRRWFWGGTTLKRLRRDGREAARAASDGESRRVAATRAEDPAAIIFTTGSTGPPKGVLYRHGNFSRQVDEIRDFYGIQPGEIDLPGFPLFALFNAAMGVSTIIPDMDFTRPAQADPRLILEAARDWKVTQAFGSPALWNRVASHCVERGERIETLRRVLSAGAPVPPHVLKKVLATIAPGGDMHTPYGATESLPVASIAASEVLRETAERTGEGAGTCVGRRFPGIDWKVIAIDDGPLATWAQVRELPRGEIGEIVVRGPVVTTEYVTRREANALHKIVDGDTFWHRIGDVGYLDDQDRFWFCGRKAHRVQTKTGTLYTDPIEGVFNRHPAVYRSALVGVGRAGEQRPVVVVECWPVKPGEPPRDLEQLRRELLQLAQVRPRTAMIHDILFHPSMPVDIRHNSKIFREKLAPWAAERLG